MTQKVTFGERLDGTDYRIRQGVYAVILEPSTQAIAVVQTPTGYFLPGGGIEHDETREACLARACLEELGCEIEMGDFLGCAERYFYSTGFDEYIVSDGYFYAAQITRKVEEPSEIDHELIWLTQEEANNHLFHEHQVWAVNQFFMAT